MNPKQIKLVLAQSEKWLELLRKETEQEITKLDSYFAVTKEPVLWKDKGNLVYKKVEIGEVWSSSLFDCAWVQVTGKIGEIKSDYYLKFDPDGEGLVYDDIGNPVRGITNITTVYKNNYGVPGKVYIPLNELNIDGDSINLWIDVANNDPFGNLKSGKLLACSIIRRDPKKVELFYDFSVLLDYAQELKNDDPEKLRMLEIIESVGLELHQNLNDEEVLKLLTKIKKGFSSEKKNDFTYYAVGHSHLDLAWLWPLRETKRKAARTFSNAIQNLKKYPNYKYGASQPQQFSWIKEEHPKLYNDLKEMVLRGRIETQGAMWVESDLNLVAGESIIRQMYYGMDFFKTEFNQDTEILWLPDVFGFPASIPQIMRGCGIDKFLTIKLGWNLVNEFPHHSFKWIGLDGSEVLVHMPPEGDYNSSSAPGALIKGFNNYKEKEIVNIALVLYGIGDGGGGPGEEHLETIKRENDIEGLPKIINAHAKDFFKHLENYKDKLPSYQGELYLEHHQGTLTSQSLNKIYNRKVEYMLSEFESLLVSTNQKTPKQLESIWKEVLLYQFHDILPGSSIKRVYDESVTRYKEITKELKTLIDLTINHNHKLSVYNSTSFNRMEYIEINEQFYHVNAKPFSFTEVIPVSNIQSGVVVSDLMLENEHIKARFSDRGEVVSLYHKESGKEMLLEHGALKLYNDIGDAWNIYQRFYKQTPIQLNAYRYELIDEKTYGGIKFYFRTEKSEISLLCKINKDSKRLDFDFEADWFENEKMLRFDYKPAIWNSFASFDIQYGYINRPTTNANSIEEAQIEVCAHKFVDISNDMMGMALLNDSKYGFRVKDEIVSMNLLRSQQAPCSDQDHGKHLVKFSLYPHLNVLDESDVYQEAYRFNKPLNLYDANESEELASMTNDHIIIDWIKPSYNEEGFIVRTFNSTSVVQHTELKVEGNIIETNLLEKNIKEVIDKELVYNPFEIKTFLIKK